MFGTGRSGRPDKANYSRIGTWDLALGGVLCHFILVLQKVPSEGS